MTPIKQKALINVDLGEAYGNYRCGPDEELIPMIDHANIACGYHAGDPVAMARAVELCKQHGVKVGAHPGLPDVLGFGRREMKLTAEEHTANVVYQVGALRGFLDRAGVALHHVKPHGVLYGMMCRDLEVARAVVAGIPAGTPMFGLAGTCMETAAQERGLPFWAELYGDVQYRADGSLVVDRVKKPWDLAEVRRHVRQQLEQSAVTAVSGEVVAMPLADYPVSVCCHSDSPGCVDIVRVTREVVDEFNAKHGFA